MHSCKTWPAGEDAREMPIGEEDDAAAATGMANTDDEDDEATRPVRAKAAIERRMEGIVVLDSVQIGFRVGAVPLEERWL